jgi:hypothetical protein
MAESTPAASKASYAWWLVLGIVGLDYFSTLAYLPSVAADPAGKLAPLAALGVVLVTLFGALPVYAYVVGRSPNGQGATGLLEKLVRGWFGKTMILVLLGFVATDFVITRSLSVADASAHIVQNPIWKQNVEWVTHHKDTVRGWFPEPLRGGFFDFWNEQLVITVVLSVLLFGFWAYLSRGFTRKFIRLAAVVVGVYLLLTAVVVGSGLVYLLREPTTLRDWLEGVRLHQSFAGTGEGIGSLALAVLVVTLSYFPRMALGLSGFELSMTSAPLVRGQDDDNPEAPRGRVRNTRKMLVAAALVMSVFILGSVLVVTLLVPEDALQEGQPAGYRALAYLAHGGPMAKGEEATALNPLFGPWFGTLYDASSVLILCLAGASVTIGMRDLVPHFLARFGMQLQWAHKVGVILHLFNVVILVVVLVFRASVPAQQWAYATSVLALLTGAAVAAFLDVKARWRSSWWRPLALAPFALIAAFFLFMAGLTAWQNRSGLTIAGLFVATVVVTAFVSRWLRSTELRFQGFAFADDHSKQRWAEICQLEFQVLVPHRPGHVTLALKETDVRRKHRLGPDVPIIFIEAEVGDPSDFYHSPLMRIIDEDGREVIQVTHCASVPHVLAAIGLEFRHVGRPPEIYFDWSHESPHAANLSFLLMGEGNVPWMVHELVRKAEPDPARRPRIVLG